MRHFWWPGRTGLSFNRRRQIALLQLLQAAAECQQPLATVVDALGSDTRGRWGRKLQNLGYLLSSGVPLHEALESTPGLLSAEALMLIQAGAEMNALLPAIREALALEKGRQNEPFAVEQTLAYFLGVASVAILIASFNIYYIIPKFKKIFADFGSELPEVTRLFLAIADVAVEYAIPLVALLSLLAMALTWVVTKWSGRSIARIRKDFLRKLFPRWDTPVLLRALRIAVEQRLPLSSALAGLIGFHTDPTLQQKIAGLEADLSEGAECWDALRERRLLSAGETAVLNSAQSAGNLAWALDLTADQVDERRSRSLRTAFEIVEFGFLLVYAGFVGLFCVAFFMPLVKVIYDIS